MLGWGHSLGTRVVGWGHMCWVGDMGDGLGTLIWGQWCWVGTGSGLGTQLGTQVLGWGEGVCGGHLFGDTYLGTQVMMGWGPLPRAKKGQIQERGPTVTSPRWH